tara:strand:- start:1622 stop:3343 length:1722 start_codon:yes stop_codon:yes gene_type:complete
MKYLNLILLITLLGCKNENSLIDTNQSVSNDYTSKVPYYGPYPESLLEQKEILKNDLLLRRFSESRKKQLEDPHHPIYHFTSPENKLNDPNGLSFWKGYWHLFYQAYPPEDPRQHWGHAISKDLIHWEDLPIAIYPNPEYQVFSGSALVEEDRVIAIYHGTRLGNMVATSNDPLLLNWEKVTDGATIPIHKTEGDRWQHAKDLPYTIFDPAIWKKDGIYYALSGSVEYDKRLGQLLPQTYLFKSKDLVSWDFMHPFIEGDRFTEIGDDNACPYFWPIGDKHILQFYSHTRGGQYYLGDYDKINDKFFVTTHGKFNFGASGPSGVHAPSVTPSPDVKGGLISIWNMNPGKKDGWNSVKGGNVQIMSLPRLLTLSKNNSNLDYNILKQEPAGDIESLRYNKKSIDRMIIPPNKEIILNEIKGNAIEIVAEINPMNSQMVEINVLRSEEREEFTKIAFYKDRGTRLTTSRFYDGPYRSLKRQYNSILNIDTSYSSTLSNVKSRPPESAPIVLEDGENLKLRIFIDKSVVEVFANGKQVVATRVFPGMESSLGVSIKSQGDQSELISLDSYQMKSIY